MSDTKKRPKSVKPKAIKVWCPVGSDGRPVLCLTHRKRSDAWWYEKWAARAIGGDWKPRPIRQFTLTPVRRKKR